MTTQPIKIHIAVTVDIDREAWTLTYGDEGTVAIRVAVQEYCEYVVQEQLRQVDVLADSEDVGR